MAFRPFQFLEKKRSKIRKRAAKHFEGLAALSTHSAGQRAEVKAGCKPVHFSLDGCPLSCYFSGSVATTSGHFVHKLERTPTPPSAWRTGTAFTASPSGASRRRPPTSSAAAASPPADATGSRWPTGPTAWWRPASGPWPPAGPTTTIAMWGWRSACCTSPSAGRAATSAPSLWRSSSPSPGPFLCGRPPPST